MLDEAVQEASPVEPGRHGESAGRGGGLEPADLLHPPDVQLQARPAGPGRARRTRLGSKRRSNSVCSREELLKRARWAATASRSRSVNGSGGSLGAVASSVKVIMH